MNSGKKLVVANWKSNGNFNLLKDLLNTFSNPLTKNLDVDIAICPPMVYLPDLARAIGSHISVGAQNVSTYNEGAYTGEVCASMLSEFGCKFCLVGHSERRVLFNEKNHEIGVKVAQLVSKNITPIVCIGESEHENELGLTNAVLTQQIKEAFSKITPVYKQRLVIAYEPVYAIGTGKVPSISDIEKAHQHIRSCISELYQGEAKPELAILYGGSVNNANAQDLLANSKIDGLLIGGASLNPTNFLNICYNKSGSIKLQNQKVDIE